MTNKTKITFSKYQEKIFEFVEKGVGNALINASAGSGKTFTLIKCLDYIPSNKKVLFCAFNRDIVGELKEKIGDRKNVDVKTIHSIGMSILYRNFKRQGFSLEIDDFKYQSYFKSAFSELVDADALQECTKEEVEIYKDNVEQLIQLSRLYLCQTPKEVTQLAKNYGGSLIADEAEVVMKLMEWGKKELNRIDFTDMVWIPAELNLPSCGLSYDWVLVDECQDLNKAQKSVVEKCKRLNTRTLHCGDPSQCLYVFAGSDKNSFFDISKQPNTIELPLSISYRCADKIVDFAHRYSENIERNEDGRSGTIMYEVPLKKLKDGDMVVCRNNAPLTKLYTLLLKEGKKSFIRGKDIGENMIKYIESFKKEEINTDLKADGLYARMYEHLFKTRDHMIKKYGIDPKMALSLPQVQTLIDQINAIEALCDNTNKTKDLLKTIKKIFSNEKKEGISLSTIHKAKGLESDRVFVLCPSLMPSKLAKLPWELEQEKNLMYVAYTRPKNTLGFLEEESFKNLNNASIDKEEIRLNYIEHIVDRLLGTKKKLIQNEANVKYVVDNAKKIELGETKHQIKEDSMPTQSATTAGFGTIIKAPRKKRKV